MVDFKKINKLTHQERVVTVLIQGRTHKNIIVICKDEEEARRMATKWMDKLSEYSLVTPSNAYLNITMAQITFGEIKMSFCSRNKVNRLSGMESDLLWIRYHSPGTIDNTIGPVMMGCRLGHTPLIIDGGHEEESNAGKLRNIIASSEED